MGTVPHGGRTRQGGNHLAGARGRRPRGGQAGHQGSGNAKGLQGLGGGSQAPRRTSAGPTHNAPRHDEERPRKGTGEKEGRQAGAQRRSSTGLRR
eukprot:9919535-Heterocapsa_arctica.AAC.1